MKRVQPVLMRIRTPPHASCSSSLRLEPIDGRVHIEKINRSFLSKTGCKASGAEFGAGIRYAVDKGWFELHERHVREAHQGGRGSARK